MRRSTSPALALVVLVIVMLGPSPGMLAKQGGTVIPDPMPNFEGVLVTCGGQTCDSTESMQRTYDVEFLPNAYVPEDSYEEAIVVLVEEGRLAFRVQTNDVVIDPQSNAGASEITILTTDIEVPFGETPSEAPQQPVYSPNGAMSDSDCSRNPPLLDLCLLNPATFADEKTFVELEQGDIVYLPAGSACFICNVTETGDGQASVQVWAPGTAFSWYDLSLQDNDSLFVGPGTTVEEPRNVLGWRLNPGSNCH